MRKILLSMAVAAAFTLALAATPEEAQAQTTQAGYICRVQFYPSSFDMLRGRQGGLLVELRTGASCEGPRVAGWICTTGASTSRCPTVDSYYNGEELRAVLQALTTQMMMGGQVTLTFAPSGAQITRITFNGT